MNTRDFFADMLRRRSEGRTDGIYSVCSANPIVLEAAMDHARDEGSPLLIEATSNQVNQYGGYTGMKPADFVAFIHHIAEHACFDRAKLILGGDHLGPLVWKSMPEAEAMPRAEEQVAAFVEAGFTKIHLDTSMRLGDDRGQGLSDTVIASRGARLCAAAEKAFAAVSAMTPNVSPPVYVIGSEVPAPGGAAGESGGDTLKPTSPEAFLASCGAFVKAFEKAGLAEACSRIVAFVVQPGVEFNGDTIFDYDRKAASALCASPAKVGRPLMFEGHSTDYQLPESLEQMVEDGIGILKVGPGLTFALREGFFALEHIERELLSNSGVELSAFADTLENVMKRDDSNWKNHYHGNAESLRRQRRYSFFDRARYYLPTPEIEHSAATLVRNLEKTGISLPLLSQYLPRSYDKVRRGLLGALPKALLKDCVRNALADYSAACKY
ncbi:MAG: class II D-tagatose-bisphosphate aldolase, non-catalytic subunit [Synergistaceae bacterium]|jgi:D-tagatose-1,6-bisphosphate aldolase subunit GatZ/KbaZ|nr:class II D-tagatose-bisphosphate aldolase, non-catalytic subunit [Synergistaceae bacterium]